MEEKITVEGLFRIYNDRLVNKGTHMLKGDRQRAEDISQEVWLEMGNQERSGGLKYDSCQGPFFTYLVGSLNKRIATHYRRKCTEKEDSLQDGARTSLGYRLDGWESVPAIDGDPAHLAQTNEIGYLIPKVLRTLPVNYLTALELCVIEGLESAPAAEIAGVNNESTMRGLLRKARIRFKEEWVFRGLDTAL